MKTWLIASILLLVILPFVLIVALIFKVYFTISPNGAMLHDPFYEERRLSLETMYERISRAILSDATESALVEEDAEALNVLRDQAENRVKEIEKRMETEDFESLTELEKETMKARREDLMKIRNACYECL